MTAEKELIRRLAQGDRAAFRELVETHKKGIFFHALEMVGNIADAEDISQEVFLKAFRSIKTFKQDARLSSWLYRITYNTCIDHLRKKSLSPEPMEQNPQNEGCQEGYWTGKIDPALDPALSAERELMQVKISGALDKVSSRERAVFLMRHGDGLQIREIAETLDISTGSVKSYLFRAVKKLQKELVPGRPGMEAFHE